jgi:hypothetical protein
MTRTLLVLALAALLVLSTWLLGWWTVPVLGVLYGVAVPRDLTPGRTAAVAAALAWGLLLLGYGMTGHVLAPLADRLAALLQLPAVGLYVATLLLPAILGGAAAALGGALRPR